MLCPAVPTTEEALTSRLLHSTIQTLEVFSIYLGKELGLYAALSSGARVTPAELARAAGIAPRYAREWLEQQAVAGVLEVDGGRRRGRARRYRLPAEHVDVARRPRTTRRTSHRSAQHGRGHRRRARSRWSRPTAAAAACRMRATAPTSATGQGGINRPAFSTDLVDALDARRCRTSPSGSAAGGARRRPRLRPRLVDDRRGARASRQRGHRLRRRRGVDRRTRARTRRPQAWRCAFECARRAALADQGPSTLVLLLEVLHDLARPVEVLAALRGGARAGRPRARRRREGAPSLSRARRRPRAPDVRLEHRALPADADGRAAVGGDRHRASATRRSASSRGGGLRPCRAACFAVDGGFFRLYRARSGAPSRVRASQSTSVFPGS